MSYAIRYNRATNHIDGISARDLPGCAFHLDIPVPHDGTCSTCATEVSWEQEFCDDCEAQSADAHRYDVPEGVAVHDVRIAGHSYRVDQFTVAGMAATRKPTPQRVAPGQYANAMQQWGAELSEVAKLIGVPEADKYLIPSACRMALRVAKP